jgi:hypothetical protein
MISATEAARIRSAYEAYERAREMFDPKRFKRGGGYTPADQVRIRTMAGVEPPTNSELGDLEAYDFVAKPPEKFSAYYNDAMTEVRAWPGNVLGKIIWKGQVRKPMGGRVTSVRVLGINGLMYVGTCNLSSGTYCTLRLSTAQRRVIAGRATTR